MMITRDNYEIYFLDFLEGNLESSQVGEFLEFLEQNPDLKDELNGLESFKIKQEEIQFSGKEKLYKTAEDTRELIEKKMVASLEGDMDTDEKQSFEAFISGNPELKRDYELYKKARLEPDLSVQFPAKSKLYRKSRPVILMTWVARAAAVVALVWGVETFFRSPDNSGKTTAFTGPVQSTVLDSVKPILQAAPKAAIAAVETPKQSPMEPSSPVEVKQPVTTRELAKKSDDVPEVSEPVVREMTAMATLEPRQPNLDLEPSDRQLVIRQASETRPGPNVLTVEEFLALQAKKVKEESILSANRIIRTGLGVISELSGEKIGFNEEDGKITSVNVDSRLIAFSIPLKKN